MPTAAEATAYRPTVAHRDPQMERAIRWSSVLLRRQGLEGEGHDGPEACARNVLAQVALGIEGPTAGDEVLEGRIADGGMRRLLGRVVARILAGVRAGWCELALEALATRQVVTVEVELTAEEDEGVVAARGRAEEQHRGLVPTRARPERVGERRWSVRMRPWGTF